MQNYQEMMQDTFDEIKQIGEGGGGIVFKAHHKRLDKDVVLKKIRTNQVGHISHRGELDLLKNLKHNYIPQVLDFIEYGNEVFTVMEYIPGQSFAQLLDQGKKFARRDVVKWLRQLCEVVNYLHSQTPPIIHCDIKPANVMLTPTGDICLIDFNISGVKSEEGIASIGFTIGYAPVEQFAVVAGRLEKLVQERERDLAFAADSVPDAEPERTEIISDVDLDKTELLTSETVATNSKGGSQDLDKTELLISETAETETALRKAASPVPANSSKSLISNMSDEEWAAAKRVEASVGKNLMIDERTDIYSVGSTFYHILTGVKPQPFYRKQTALRSIDESISESLAYIIEKAMAISPADRFKNSGQLMKVVHNMGTVDRRYKALVRQQIMIAVLMAGLTVASVFAVTLGRSAMAREKAEQYQAYIEEMETARAGRDYDAVYDGYEKALELFAEKADAYYEAGMAYYEQKQYEQCIDFLSRNVYTNSAIEEGEDYGNFYYITGSCYFELEDYGMAVSYYQRAVNMQPEEISYYRDYVIALARNGAIEEAEQVLKQVQEKGMSADVLSLLNGEIALLRGNYQECGQYLTDCIADTSDDYIRVRAYTKMDDAYQLMYTGAEQYERRIASLSDALEILPDEYQVTLMERLAQTYIDYSDIGDMDDCCEEAISLFSQMEKMGYATFTSRYNVAVLYEKMEKYAEAQGQLEVMLEDYPENYSIYKRKAFVELRFQAGRENSERDYHAFEEYYMRAQELYKENAGTEDMEMLSLQQLYNDVVANGWL